MVDHATPTPSPRAAPATANTRIWIVDVGALPWVKAVVRANDTPITISSAPVPRGWAVSRSATVCSTAWLATAAPSRARGAMTTSACHALTARRAWGMPMHAPV